MKSPITTLLGVLVFALALSSPPTAYGQGEFLRGDTNSDGMFGLPDALLTLNYMFLGGQPGACLDAHDFDDNGAVLLTDVLQQLNYLFNGGLEPAAPFPGCGFDPTPDTLSCDGSPLCGLGGPIMGLTPAEMAAFNRGKEVMVKKFGFSDGLGPLYNAISCASCHSTPEPGGSSPRYRNFFLAALGVPGSQTPLPGLPSLVVPSFAGFEVSRPGIPNTPNLALTQRNAPPFFGVGMFEFVGNGTILSGADPNDLNSDGISGRYNTDGFGNLGRFGYKLQANFIEAFNRGAAFNQMGITTDPAEGGGGIVFWRQVGAGFDEPTTDTDAVPDPEMSVQDLSDLTAFNRFLAPPSKRPFGPAENAGEALFDQLNCTGCHFPTLNSSKGPLNAYTDLLLHDMGPELADGLSFGLPQTSTISPLTTANEFRTQPLWGVSLHRPYLHDGRADTLHDAIEMHGGEGQAARDAYMALTPAQQADLIAFLEAI